MGRDSRSFASRGELTGRFATLVWIDAGVLSRTRFGSRQNPVRERGAHPCVSAGSTGTTYHPHTPTKKQPQGALSPTSDGIVSFKFSADNQ